MEKSDMKPMHAIGNIVRTRIQLAQAALRDMTSIDDQAVHSARKDLKCARAGLRLLRGTIAERRYTAENIRLRDAAHLLSQVRDAKVLLDTAGNLLQREKNTSGRVVLKSLVTLLKTERESLHDNVLGRAGTFNASLLMLTKSERAIARWFVARQPSDPQKILNAAIGRLYRKSREAAEQAFDRSTDDALHEARKQSKYLALALEVLTAAGTHRATTAIQRSKAIAEFLGADRDLALVYSRLQTLLKGGVVARQKLLESISERRTKLQRKVFREAKALYKPKPQTFLKQIIR
ncbi:MAG TPA: CHAD domain-containing protein [Burkholderiales bacterium]|nr:CHAD domain-containing protein [Burkholderiales bacterium]